MKANLEFDMCDFEDKQDLRRMLKSTDMVIALDEIWNRVFRPNRKHGYGNPVLDGDMADEVIEELTKIYLDILQDYGLQEDL